MLAPQKNRIKTMNSSMNTNQLGYFLILLFLVFEGKNHSPTVGANTSPQTNHLDHVDECNASTIFINSFHPVRGPEDGGTNITIGGLGFPLHRSHQRGLELEIFCYFDDTIAVRVTYSNSNSAVCVSPIHMPGKTRFSIVMCGHKIQPVFNGGFFEFTATSSLHSISPAVGSFHGGTKVLIVGNNFVNSPDLNCKFDETTVQATFINSNELSCITPSQLSPRQSIVQVSNNGIHFEGTLSNVVFNFIRPSTVYSITPKTAPSIEGTLLTINGMFEIDFTSVDDMYCKVGDFVIPATNADRDFISCLTPDFPYANKSSKMLHAEVSINGGIDFTNYGKTRLLVHPPVYLESIHPQLGPEYGGTLLSIFGENFFRSDDLYCDFGHAQVKSEWISSSLLQCLTPPSRPRTSHLRISTNGQESGFSSNFLNFTYFNAITVSSIFPVHGKIKGGTPITVRGTGFLNIPSFYCVFGERIVKPTIIFNSTALVCESLSVYSNSSRSSVKIHLSGNHGHDKTSSQISFFYEDPPSIQSIYPRVGPKSGGTMVSILGVHDFLMSTHGTSLISRSDVACRFGETVVPGYYTSNEEILCRSPPLTLISKNGVNVCLEITTNGVDFVSSGIQFMYHPTVSLFSALPNLGSENGGTMVTLKGRNFLRSDSLSCIFGKQYSSSVTWISSSVINCVAPKAEFGYHVEPVVTIVVSLDGQQIQNHSNVTFTYQPAAHISFVKPLHGSIRGGFPLHIFGGGFSNIIGTKALCKFGGIGVKVAQVINDSEVTCMLPSISTPMKITLSLSFNYGYDYISSDAAVFQYTYPPLVMDIFPKIIPYTGKVSVTVQGNYLTECNTDKLLFLLGENVIEASSWNETVVTFLAPAFRPNTDLSRGILFSKNGGHEYTSDGLDILYSQPPQIRKVMPPFAHELGGVNITIIGLGFTHTPDLSCIVRCGPSKTLCGTVSAIFLSSLKIVCTVPQSKCGFGTGSIEVSMTGESNLNNPSTIFRYNPMVSVSSLYPNSGPVSGGTNLKVEGYFWLDGSFACTFWSDDLVNYFTLATMKSETELSCTVPPSHDEKADKVPFSISVIYEGKIYDSGDLRDTFFSYDEGVFILGIVPSSGPQTGGTKINLKGANFVNSSSLTCRFLFGDIYMRSLATFLSTQSLSCITPPIFMEESDSKAITQIDISSNGIDFSNSCINFWFHALEEVLDVSPKLISEGSEWIVNVKGRNFRPHDGLRCRLESNEHVFIDVSSLYLSAQLVSCIVPDLIPGEYKVAVSNNGVDFFSSIRTINCGHILVNRCFC